MFQTKEKHDCLVLSRSLTFELYEDDMIFRVFIVINFIKTNGKKGPLDENDFRHCPGNFFRKCHSES